MSDERTRPSRAYSRRFYAPRHASSVHAAGAILPPILEAIAVGSAIDFGCGVGTWLAVAREHGVNEVMGVDGSWVDRSLLVIDPDEFVEHDLSTPLGLSRRFDLALSLEVAEHLPPECGRAFVDQLCRAADCVLFSAAVPGQGGRRHLNEQWQSSWARLFLDNRFAAIDCVRPEIWTDPDIAWWYKQNTILYVNESSLEDTSRRLGREPVADISRLDLVHPELLQAKQAKLDSPAALAERLVKLVLRRSGR